MITQTIAVVATVLGVLIKLLPWIKTRISRYKDWRQRRRINKAISDLEDERQEIDDRKAASAISVETPSRRSKRFKH